MASPRSEGLQVIGGGLMRTGTTSLHVALGRLLGGKCYHMKSVIEDPKRHIQFWRRACQEKLSDEEWRDFFKDYSAAVDFPPVAFYERLMEVYPDAKVVLSVRDPEKWFQSVNNTIAKFLQRATSFPIGLIICLTPMGNFPKMITELFETHFKFDITKKFQDRAVMLQAYEDHVAKVKRTVPADKLLVFQAVEGWQPLCDFLGVPVPDEPYPRVNTSEDFESNVKQFLDPMKLLLLVGAVVALAAGFGFLAFSRLFKN